MTGEISLAGGCFWGTEHFFKLIDGVTDTQVGYANGTVENPSYEQVCTHKTGHAETVKVVYDPEKIGLEFLLDMYFKAIDPTLEDQQGHDVGPQYRTGIYYTDLADLPIIEKRVAVEAERYHSTVSILPRNTIRTTSTRTPTATATFQWASLSLLAARSPREKRCNIGNGSQCCI